MRWPDSPIALVARREVTEGFRSKAVKVLIVISVVAVAAMITIANLASGSSSSRTELVVVGEASPTDLEHYEMLGTASGTEVEVLAVDSDEAARAAIEDGADVAILAGSDTILTRDPVSGSDPSARATFVAVLRAELTLSNGLEGVGLDDEERLAVLSQEPPVVTSVRGEADDDDTSRVPTAIAMNIGLFILLQTYGGWVISGVTREKASRVVEVLLATITARRLMLGKIAGIGVVALIHAAILISTALITATVVGINVADGFRAADVAVGAVWFLLGYALYCSALAAAGSLCSRAEDAQGVALPIMIPLIAGYLVAFSAAGGATPVLWVLSFFPPTAVMCMPVLNAIGAAPGWAVLVSMAITAITAFGTARLAATIFSRSVLRTGKRVRWREALGRRPDRVTATT